MILKAQFEELIHELERLSHAKILHSGLNKDRIFTTLQSR